jgi:hypothetical protein
MDVIIQNWSCLTVKVFFSADISNQSIIAIIKKTTSVKTEICGKCALFKWSIEFPRFLVGFVLIDL